MDAINPWLDPTEVRRLAEGLIRPVRDPAISVTEAGFDAAFVGFAAQQPAPPSTTPAISPGLPTSSAEPTSVSAEPATIQPAPPASPETPALREPEQPAEPEIAEDTIPSSARGPFLERIQHFRDWTHHQFGASGIFILDREGSVIFDESSHGRLHFLARSLALASRRQGSSSSNVHVKIGVGATLEVIPVETDYGCLVLGAVVPEALPPAAVSAVMKALSQVATPPKDR